METGLATNNGTETELMAPTSTEGLHFINPAEMPDLDAAEAGVSLEMKYYEFVTAGQIVRAIYNGVTTINKKDQKTGEMGTMKAVVFQTKDGVYLNSGDNLMSQLSKLLPGSPIQITFEGKEKTASGNNVNKFSVRILNVSGYASKLSTPAGQPQQPASAKTPPTRAEIVSRYDALLKRAAKAGVPGIETWYINDKMTDVEILETGKALREISESYEQEKAQEFPF